MELECCDQEMISNEVLEENPRGVAMDRWRGFIWRRSGSVNIL